MYILLLAIIYIAFISLGLPDSLLGAALLLGCGNHNQSLYYELCPYAYGVDGWLSNRFVHSVWYCGGTCACIAIVEGESIGGCCRGEC